MRSLGPFIKSIEYDEKMIIGLIEKIERDPTKCIKLTPQEIENGN